MSTASIVIPVYCEGRDLIQSLESITAASQELPVSAELILVVQGYAPPSLRTVQGYWPHIRVIRLPTPGKFSALRAGAAAADGSILILVDADSLPDRAALSRLLSPIIAGVADVSASHPLVMAGRRTSNGVVDRWSRVTAHAWHVLRTSHPANHWALPGPLYAIRRALFPPAVLVPLIDDASIGIAALEQGARIAYTPEAVIWIRPSSSYREWCRQKLRTRRGWELLRRRRPEMVDSLRASLTGSISAAAKDNGERFRFMLWHDTQLRRVARLTASETQGRAGSWRPDRPRPVQG